MQPWRSSFVWWRSNKPKAFNMVPHSLMAEAFHFPKPTDMRDWDWTMVPEINVNPNPVYISGVISTDYGQDIVTCHQILWINSDRAMNLIPFIFANKRYGCPALLPPIKWYHLCSIHQYIISPGWKGGGEWKWKVITHYTFHALWLVLLDRYLILDRYVHLFVSPRSCKMTLLVRRICECVSSISLSDTVSVLSRSDHLALE